MVPMMKGEQLSAARSDRKKRLVKYEPVRVVLAQLKEMMRSENDRAVKMIIAQAGIEINKILLK
jgi:hypothetical protein